MNRLSLKFKHISMNVTKLILAVITNQNFLRYVSYLDHEDPLSSQRDDISPLDVKDDNFILTKFNDKILRESKIVIFFNPYEGSFTHRASNVSTYTMDIIVPYDYWIIEDTGELRAYSIAHEIAKVIDQKNVAGIGLVDIASWESYKVNNSFSGLTLAIRVTDGTVK